MRGVWNTRRNTRKETTGTRVGMEFTKKDIRAWGGGEGGTRAGGGGGLLLLRGWISGKDSLCEVFQVHWPFNLLQDHH